MTFGRSLQNAVRALRKEEETLAQRLEALRSKIQDLEAMGRDVFPRARKAGAKGKRRLSAKGRAAISRAAKRRWAQYRAQKKG